MIVIDNLTPTSSLPRLALALIKLVRSLGVVADAKLLTGKAIATSQTPIAHQCSGPPQAVFAMGNADARIWESAAADQQFVYLTASAAVTAKLLIIKGANT